MGPELKRERNRIPEWVTGAEASFLTGDTPEILRSDVMSGRVALIRPFGPGDGFVLLRTADLIRRRPASSGSKPERTGPG